MSPSERREMIRKENTKLSLTRQCKLLKISRSSIYYAPVGVNAETLKLMHEIDRVFTKHPFFGSRQIAAYLPQSGFSAGRHRVRHLMNIMGLQAIYKGPNTIKKHPQHRIYPYLLRKLEITRPNQVRCSDITYIPVKNGFLYLVAIMDWATRKVLTWRLSNTLDASFCVEVLEEAVYLHEITDGFQAKWIIDNWIESYNSERPHTALDKQTPDIAYFSKSETRKAA